MVIPAEPFPSTVSKYNLSPLLVHPVAVRAQTVERLICQDLWLEVEGIHFTAIPTVKIGRLTRVVDCLGTTLVEKRDSNDAVSRNLSVIVLAIC